MTNNSPTNMSDNFMNFDPNANPYAYLGLVRNPDSSVTRVFEFPTISPSSDPRNPVPVLTKDISLNEAKKTWVRVFLPRRALEEPSHAIKLPLIVDFYGGGFVVGSPAFSVVQDFYTTITAEFPAVIVAVDYRLAPEQRLPAAYDDCMEALYWIKNTKEEWLINYADFSRCYLMGSSAGGNIAYHVGLHASSKVDELEPLMIKGLILHQPFFGGKERTKSEMRLFNNKVLPLCVTDIMWELSLPIGADRDHEYSNPMVGIKTELLDRIRQLRWKILVTGFDGDLLLDRQIEFVKMMEENGLQVVSKFEVGGCHGFEFFAPVSYHGRLRSISTASRFPWRGH